MKTILRAAISVLLLAPTLAFAAYNDVSLTTDTVITVGSYSLNVSGSTAVIQSIVVNGSTFAVTMLPNSSFAVTSSDKVNFNFDIPAPITQVFSCASSYSSLSISNVSTTVTLTITPTGTCSTSSSSSSSGGGGGAIYGGGGGGGGGYSPPATPSTTKTPSPPAPSGAPTFSGEFGLGAKGADVITLQSFLEAKGLLTIPKGIAKGYFGALTKKALQAYQKSHGINQTGYLGPKTRAAIASGK